MANINHKKTSRDDESIDQSLSQPAIDRYADWPKYLREKSFHEIWRPGGPGGLYRRAEQENKLGHLTPQPLSNEQLAQLLEECDGEPLPSALRNLVVRELRKKRRERPGRKANLSPSHRLERLLLPALYEHGTLIARRYRRRLLLIETRKKRRHLAEQIPTEAEVALRYVQKWLPSSSKTLANKLSAIKDPSEKKPRAKATKR
jgi:hypothetical protein